MEAYTTYPTISIDKRLSTLSIQSKNHDSSEYAINRFSQKYDSYQEFYKAQQQRQRLSSTGEGSGDSSTTTSGSSYGEREDMSETRTESEENEREAQEKPYQGVITPAEREQIESFFRGLKTEVYVCNSLANLYVKSPEDSDWKLKYEGIPVVILDRGESRARTKRCIKIALAERGTGFMLWHDIVDNLSSYKMEGPTFHTMCFSEDHKLQIGFSFDMCMAAEELGRHVETLVARPENVNLSTPGKKKKKKTKKQPKPAPLPPKTHISQPCCFQHVTTVEVNDAKRYFSLRELLPRSVLNSSINTGMLQLRH